MMKPLRQPSLDTFCHIHEMANGQANITCPANDYNVMCLKALERRGLIVWDIERPGGQVKWWCALTATGAQFGCDELALSSDGTEYRRNRKWLKTQFDLNKPQYREAYQIAGALANNRVLASTIRDLLRIHKAATQGDFTLFHQLYGIPETKETAQFEGMFALMDKMQSTIDDLTEQIRTQSHETTPKQGLPAPQGLTPIAGVKSLDVPVFDDDDGSELVVRKDAAAGDVAVNNFLSSISKLQDN